MLRSGNIPARAALNSVNENTDDAGRLTLGNIGVGAFHSGNSREFSGLGTA